MLGDLEKVKDCITTGGTLIGSNINWGNPDSIRETICGGETCLMRAVAGNRPLKYPVIKVNICHYLVI